MVNYTLGEEVDVDN